MELEINGKDFSCLADFNCKDIIDFIFAVDMSTVYAWIQARASISFLALETRLQNETDIYLCSTMLTPGCMVHEAPHGTYIGNIEPR